jgi:hypothetical protein
LFELLERLARLDPKRVDKRRSRRPVDIERFDLTIAPVESEHEKTAKSLPQRMRDDERLELRDDIRVPPEREVRSDPVLPRDESQLLEAAYLPLSPSLVFDVRQRSTALESERGTKRPRRVGGLFRTRAAEQTLELDNVGIGNAQQIAGPVSLDGLRRQRAA